MYYYLNYIIILNIYWNNKLNKVFKHDFYKKNLMYRSDYIIIDTWNKFTVKY